MPERIQRRRTKGWTMPSGAVYVGRPTKWGNPFRVGHNAITPHHVGAGWALLDSPGTIHYPRNEHEWLQQHPPRAIRCETPEQAVRWFRAALTELPKADIRRDLAGRDLACWCPLPEPGETDWCHAAVLLELANGGAK